MSSVARTVLYATPTADRFFLVPRGQELATGDLTVVAVAGEVRQVSPAAISPYEVTREEAQAHVRAEAECALATVAETLERVLGIAGKEPLDLRRLAEQLGGGGSDPHSAKAALARLADDVQAISAAVVSGSPTELDQARARLEARGLDLGDTLDDLRRRLEELKHLDRHSAAASLRRLADDLEGSEEPLGTRIDDLLDRLERQIGPLLGSTPEEVQTQRQEGYLRDARSAIAESLREAGIKPLSDADQ
jgi:hypothetical protein